MLKKILVTAVCALLIGSCAESPTGRKQVMLFDNKQLNTMGAQTFEQMNDLLSEGLITALVAART